jgi:hypothetical protein
MGQPVEVRVLSRAALVDICEAFFKDNAHSEGIPSSRLVAALSANRCSHNLCHIATNPDAPDRGKAVVTVKMVPTVSGLLIRIVRSICSDLISASAVATSPQRNDGQGKDHSPHAQGRRRRLTNLFFPGRFPSRGPASFHQLGKPSSPGGCNSTFFLG